jgi:hypothetical protein
MKNSLRLLYTVKIQVIAKIKLLSSVLQKYEEAKLLYFSELRTDDAHLRLCVSSMEDG